MTNKQKLTLTVVRFSALIERNLNNYFGIYAVCPLVMFQSLNVSLPVVSPVTTEIITNALKKMILKKSIKTQDHSQMASS